MLFSACLLKKRHQMPSAIPADTVLIILYQLLGNHHYHVVSMFKLLPLSSKGFYCSAVMLPEPAWFMSLFWIFTKMPFLGPRVLKDFNSRGSCGEEKIPNVMKQTVLSTAVISFSSTHVRGRSPPPSRRRSRG